MKHYNPDWLDDDTLIGGFIARRGDFAFLRGELARVPLKGSAQHHIIVGQRGAGKTTLLKRLAAAIRRDEDLRGHLVALSFPEELYGVTDLASFWWAACEALADELDRSGQAKTAERLYGAVDAVRSPESGKSVRQDAGFDLLLGACEELARRPVLLVDNFDMVLDRIDKKGRKLKNPLSPVYWALREALSKDRSPVMIGGSVRLTEQFKHYDKAFYDFFLPRRLGMLPIEEVREMLRHLAKANDAPEVEDRLEKHPARIETLHQLTGGNPRAVGLIFDLLRHGPGRRAIEDFERLMDLSTPYYKDRIEELSEQAQVVMQALAARTPGKDGEILRFGHTAAELGAYAGLETNIVSAQLNILERDGLVEKFAGEGRTQYRIAEQLFRLWLQMRTSRRIRQNVVGLSEFLQVMFDHEELTSQLREARGLIGAKLAHAVACASRDEGLRRGLEAHGAGLAYEHAAATGDDVRELLAPGDVHPEVEGCLELRRKLRASDGHDLEKDEQDALVGSLGLGHERKEELVEALCGGGAGSAEAAASVREMQKKERAKLLRKGMKSEDLPLLYELRASGQLLFPLLAPPEAVCRIWSAPGVKAMLWRLAGAQMWVNFSAESAGAWLDWGRREAVDATSEEWANVAGAMRRAKQHEAAGKVLEEAFKRGESSRAWHERALFLEEGEGDYPGAEQAYRKTVELDPSNSRAWNNLGILLDEHLERYDDAESAFRRGIEFDPANAVLWYNLGILLVDHLERYDEAEGAYRKAIELDPANAALWYNLGILLVDHLGKYDEAEGSYRKAIEFNPAHAMFWNNLGILLAEHLKRYDEAEDAYRKAIELDPEYALPWNNLGVLLAEHLKRYDEAEDAYRKAIEFDPSRGMSWGNLGRYLERSGNIAEAREAYKKASELGAEFSRLWVTLFERIDSRIWTDSLCEALRTGDMDKVQESLAAKLNEPEGSLECLASDAFVEKFLGSILAEGKHAESLARVMREAGFEKHARPLLLAFEAALRGKQESLKNLEPEVRSAAMIMYRRLMDGRKAHLPAGGNGKRKKRQ